MRETLKILVHRHQALSAARRIDDNRISPLACAHLLQAPLSLPVHVSVCTERWAITTTQQATRARTFLDPGRKRRKCPAGRGKFSRQNRRRLGQFKRDVSLESFTRSRRPFFDANMTNTAVASKGNPWLTPLNAWQGGGANKRRRCPSTTGRPRVLGPPVSILMQMFFGNWLAARALRLFSISE